MKERTNVRRHRDYKPREKEDIITYNEVAESWKKLFNNGSPTAVANALGAAYSNNPYIQSERVRASNTLPVFFERDRLERAMKDMPNHDKELRAASWNAVGVYQMLKLYYMYTDILTYRNYITPKYVGKSEVSRKDFWAEHKYVHKFKDLLDPKRTFRNIAQEVLIEGKAAYCTRIGFNKSELEKGTKLSKLEYVTFQKIPSDYWKITGFNSESRFTVSVDFTLFWEPGFSVEQYPPIFKKYFEEFMCNMDGSRRPKAGIEGFPSYMTVEYRNGKYFYWAEMPINEVFVFSHCEAHSWQVPNFSGLFLQSQDLQSYSYLQEELLQLPLSSVIVGTLPLNNPTSKTGAFTNNFSLSPEALTFFQEMFNSVAPRGVKFMLSPAEGYQHFKFDNSVPNNLNIVTATQQQWLTSSGTSGLISTTDKPSQAMVKSAQKLEPRYTDRFYEQWMNAINIIFEKKIGTKYTWRFFIEGDVFNDQDEYNKCKDALAIGQNDVMPQYKSFFNEDMEDVMSRQHYIKASKIYDNFEIVESAFNSKSEEGKNDVGRKKEEDTDNDNTAQSQENGSNTSDGRVVDFIKNLSYEEMEELSEIIMELGDYNG